jgi:cytochrome c-type biogenesis protein CcmE
MKSDFWQATARQPPCFTARKTLYNRVNQGFFMAKKNSKSIYAAALGFFLLGVGYLMFTGLTANTKPFVNVSEALAMPRAELRSARLFGTVKGEGLMRMEDRPGVKFQLKDKDNAQKTLWVVFEGPVPDLFKPGAEVIVDGGLPEGEYAFKAKTLMTKCPSKYEKATDG